MVQVFGTESNRVLNHFSSGLHWVVCVHSGDTRNVSTNRYKPNSIAAIKHSLLFLSGGNDVSRTRNTK